MHNRAISDTSTSLSDRSTPYKFTGKEQDPETGWYSFKHRYYDPRLGQWISPDPALHEYLPYMNKTAKEDLHGGGVFTPVHLALYSYAGNNPLIFIDPDGLKIFNIVINGDGGRFLGTYWRANPFDHNITMHVDDDTGKITFYEVTGPNSKNANVFVRDVSDFKSHYKERVGDLKKKGFDFTKSAGGYDVVEVKGVNEQKVLGYLNTKAEEYAPGKKNYPFSTDSKNPNDCATFSYEAYKAGGKEFTPEPRDLGENPRRFPSDLNQAIKYHNSKTEGGK